MSQTPEQELVTKWEAKFEACARIRKKYEQEWFSNIAFYFGKHYIEWSKNSGTNVSSLIIPRAPAWRVRLVSNRVKPVIRKEIAKINKERPRFYAIPSTADEEDIAKARAADAVAEHLLINQVFTKKKRQAIWWTTLTGTGFIKTYAESEDVKFASPSTFHLWVPNLEEPDIQEQPFVIHGIAMEPSEIKAAFGVELEPDTTTETHETKFLQAMGVEKKPKELQQVFVKEFWVKPNAEFPNGAMFIIGGGKLLYLEEGEPELEIDEVTGEPVVDPETNEPIQKERLPSNILGGGPVVSKFPYSHGRYPFSKIEHIPTGKFYGESVLVDLIPLQKEYNRSRSQGVEAVNLTAKPQYKVPKGSVDVSKMVAKPGLVIEYTPGFDPPSVMENPELPAHFHQNQAQALNDMDYISNQHEITQGRTPPGIEAASAIAYLQEESDSILQPTIDSLEEAVEDCGFQAITLAKDYWPVDRIVKIVSGNMVYETLLFKEDTLPDQLDFKVEKGSMAPRSRAGKNAQIMELVKMGLIPGIEGLKYMEMSEVGRLYEDLQVDSRQVERENHRMKNGQPVPLNEFDNDEIHAIYHAKYMKSQTYETLDPQVQQVFLEHYKQHLQRIGRIEENAGTVGDASIRDESGGTSPES